MTADVDLVETARAAGFFGADGVVLTGSATGVAADTRELEQLCQGLGGDRPDLAVVVGSGVTPQNVRGFRSSTALIVGSYFKKDGHWANDLDRGRILEMIDAVRSL